MVGFLYMVEVVVGGAGVGFKPWPVLQEGGRADTWAGPKVIEWFFEGVTVVVVFGEGVVDWCPYLVGNFGGCCGARVNAGLL